MLCVSFQYTLKWPCVCLKMKGSDGNKIKLTDSEEVNGGSYLQHCVTRHIHGVGSFLGGNIMILKPRPAFLLWFLPFLCSFKSTYNVYYHCQWEVTSVLWDCWVEDECKSLHIKDASLSESLLHAIHLFCQSSCARPAGHTCALPVGSVCIRFSK